ncbi:MAG: hypothetical protein ACREOO_04170 [bacterium]
MKGIENFNYSLSKGLRPPLPNFTVSIQRLVAPYPGSAGEALLQRRPEDLLSPD